MTFHRERRLDRALYHLESFKAERAAWREERPHRFWTEFDAASGKKVIWAQVLKPPPASLSLIAGDCIHNLRAALDNLAFELALAYTEGPLPPEVEGYSAFPIFHKDIAEYPRSLKRFNDMTAGIDPIAVAEIKRLQPYNRGDWFFRDRLWQLNQLEVIDKHRLPHTTTLNNLSALSFFEPDGIGIEEIETLFTFFDESAPIAQYPAFDSTGTEVNVDFTAAFDVCFSEGVPGGLLGCSISSTLKSCHLHIVNKVLPMLSPFLLRP
jgi:hypothetical protein